MGEAANPGKLDVKRGTTLLQAFAQMGGFSPFAATKRVQLHRDGKIQTSAMMRSNVEPATPAPLVLQNWRRHRGTAE